MTKRNPKFDALLAKHAGVLTELHRNLAMNFAVPSRDLMQLTAAEMKISLRALEALEEYRAAQEELNSRNSNERTKTMSEVYTETNWLETIAAMHSGRVIEIDEGVYEYFLEVLPPVHMGYKATLPDGQVVRASFGFAEGYEPVTAFWSQAGRFFCCRTKEMNPHA